MRHDLLADLTAQTKSDAHIELRMNQRIEG